MAHAITSPARLPIASPWLSNADVLTISEIRHANLLRLIAQAGSITAFAAKIDRSHSQVSQIKNRYKHSKSGEPREVGDDMARWIEQCFGLASGWMDSSHESAQPPSPNVHRFQESAATYSARWPFRTITREQIEALDDGTLSLLEEVMRPIVANATGSAARSGNHAAR